MEQSSEILQNLKSFVESKTVTGEPIKINDKITVIPFTKISFGLGTGTLDGKSAVGLGGAVAPVGFMVINGDDVSFITTTEKSSFPAKIADLAQEIAGKFISKKEKKEDTDNEE